MLSEIHMQNAHTIIQNRKTSYTGLQSSTACSYSKLPRSWSGSFFFFFFENPTKPTDCAVTNCSSLHKFAHAPFQAEARGHNPGFANQSRSITATLQITELCRCAYYLWRSPSTVREIFYYVVHNVCFKGTTICSEETSHQEVRSCTYVTHNTKQNRTTELIVAEIFVNLT